MLLLRTIKDECFPVTFNKGSALFEEKAWRNIDIHEDEDFPGEICVDAEVKGSHNKWYEVSLVVDNDDDIVTYDCECPAANNYWGMCKHCVALALYYRSSQKTSYTQSIPSKSSKESRTSEALKNLMVRYAVQDKMHLFEGYYKEVDLEPVISRNYLGLQIEFKIGNDRKYVLKNIAKLIDDIDKIHYVEYGKNLAFTHDRSAFTDRALMWIDAMRDIMNTSFNRMRFEDQIFNSNFRSIGLTAYGIDRCFQMLLGQDVVIDKEIYEIKEEDPLLTLNIRNQDEQGVTVTAVPIELLEGNINKYFLKDHCIYRLSQDYVKYVLPVLRAAGGIKGDYRYSNAYHATFLGKEDYTAFCGNILPVISPYLDVHIEGIDFDEYMPQEAELCVYLSLDEEDSFMIHARAEAIYGSRTYDVLGTINLEKEYRDIAREKQLVELMTGYLVMERRGQGVVCFCRDEENVCALLEEGIPRLQSLASVFIDDKIRGIKILKSPKVAVGVGIKGSLLDLKIQMEDLTLTEIDQILAAYRRRKKYYRMRNGDFISLENNGLAILSELAQGLMIGGGQIKSENIDLPKYRMGYIDAVLKNPPEGLEVHRDLDFKRMVRDMREYDDSDFDIPAELNARLRHYQKTGFRWLAMLDQWGLGGILADDMGLGKTLQVIALLLLKNANALVVCPASLVYNWESELHRFAPGLRAVAVVGSLAEREELIRSAEGRGVWITSYDLLKRDTAFYEEHSFEYMIIDEAQYIKNAGTQVAKAVKSVKADHRFALTGTPIENRLSDMWSIFDFIMPGYLYSYPKFRDEFEYPIVRSDDEDAGRRLRRMVQPFILRRRKNDVLKDLPEKTEEVYYAKMDSEQRKLYDAHVLQLQAQLMDQSDDAFRSDSIKYLAELTKLRQICCSPSLCYENYTGTSAKQELCMELVENAIAGEHRILLFSQFTQMLDALGEELKRRGIEYLYLSGKDSKERRRHLVEHFQKGEAPVFLISLKAGGTGLNLTAADMVIHYDPWWNAAAQNQASDRAHRIGQEKHVTVMKLVTRDTIEEKIIEIQDAKLSLAEDIIEGKGTADHRLSRQEMLELLTHR